MRRYHNLTPEEERVIVHKGTEMPGTGKYYLHSLPGIYVCKKCDNPLYISNNKFSSGCGWPSFDEEIAGSVERCVDADGRRIEILCKRCHGHLGHVFKNEYFTKKNVRHCVNSISLSFIPAFNGEGLERALLGAGCFWEVEEAFKKLEGIAQTTVGFSGGQIIRPSYEEVCTGETGHMEVVELFFDNKVIKYEELIDFFFSMHDSTRLSKVQYRSVIFYFTQEQKESAEFCKKKIPSSITEILPASIFYRSKI